MRKRFLYSVAGVALTIARTEPNRTSHTAAMWVWLLCNTRGEDERSVYEVPLHCTYLRYRVSLSLEKQRWGYRSVASSSNRGTV